jgi:hypothetical protein
LAAFFSPTYYNTSWITASLELKLIHSFALSKKTISLVLPIVGQNFRT